MTYLTVHEWGRVDVGDKGFKRHQADALLDAARRHRLGGIDGTDILCDHHLFLRARQAVGVVAGRGCSLEILPKVDPDALEGDATSVRKRLVHMLDVALGLNLSVGESTTMARDATSLLEIFIALFADRLLAEVRRGLPRQYRTHEADLAALRGRLDVVRQFTANAVRPDRLACRFDALDSDIPLMQVMKACVLLLVRHARSATTQRKLVELRFLLADVRDVPRGAVPWDQVRIDRSSRRWRGLLALAKLLIGSEWQETRVNAGAPDGITLLFPMHKLFERYIAVQLRQALVDTRLKAEVQGGGKFCLGRWRDDQPFKADSHSTRPDILISQGGRVVTVIDTKWKDRGKGLAQADLYQMMAYARLYACERLILLYPATPGEDVYKVDAYGIPPNPDRLELAAIALDSRPSDIRASLRRIVLDERP